MKLSKIVHIHKVKLEGYVSSFCVQHFCCMVCSFWDCTPQFNYL